MVLLFFYLVKERFARLIVMPFVTSISLSLKGRLGFFHFSFFSTKAYVAAGFWFLGHLHSMHFSTGYNREW